MVTSSVVVFGGTGYAGSAIVNELDQRGHSVKSIGRKTSNNKIDGVEYIEGNALDSDFRRGVIKDSDVVITALSPRGDMTGKVTTLYNELVKELSSTNVRLFVIGGFGSLRSKAGAGRFVEDDSFPSDYRAGALELAAVLDILQSDSSKDLDWLYISPAQDFGAYNPGGRKGSYRVGGEIALFDTDGKSQLSSLDLATAIVDEIEKPAFNKKHISISY